MENLDPIIWSSEKHQKKSLRSIKHTKHVLYWPFSDFLRLCQAAEGWWGKADQAWPESLAMFVFWWQPKRNHSKGMSKKDIRYRQFT